VYLQNCYLLLLHNVLSRSWRGSFSGNAVDLQSGGRRIESRRALPIFRGFPRPL
jgi:hypothetical protein